MGFPKFHRKRPSFILYGGLFYHFLTKFKNKKQFLAKMIKNYRLFFTPSCPNCPDVKKFMETLKVKGEFVDASTKQGSKEASKLSIFSVPTVIFFNEKGLEESRASTIEEIKRISENRTLI